MSGSKVLIVDDRMYVRMVLRDILETNGFEIIGEAETGKEAVVKFKNLSPDLVTLDITMPDMDGLTALDLIMEVDPKAFVIMVTAMGQKSNVLRALEQGAKGFIVKPFKEDKVMEVIKKIMAAKELVQ